MAESLGFRCDHCGHIIFVSTTYFAEETICPECHKSVEIPFMIYAWMRPPWPLVVLLGFLGLGTYAQVVYGPVFGSTMGWLGNTLWCLALLVALMLVRMLIRGPLEVFLYMPYVKRLPEHERRRFAASGRRARLAAAGGDDLMLLVPIAVFTGQFFLYRWSLPAAGNNDPIAIIRGPWIFLLLGVIIAGAVGLPLVWAAFRLSMSRSQ